MNNTCPLRQFPYFSFDFLPFFILLSSFLVAKTAAGAAAVFAFSFYMFPAANPREKVNEP